ncbi:MAG: ABC transporter substrate-binding protein [Caldilineaceae bacterium]
MTRGTLRLPHPLVHSGKESLDPSSPTNFAHVTVLLYDRLARLDENGVPQPALATAWQANDDATEWTFTLREGVTFHDGEPLTSADVAYTFARILDPDLQSPMAATLALLAETTTPDDGTIVFKLNQGHADFPLLLTSRMAAIIPAESGETIAISGVGTGPFKLETLAADGATILSANDAYWQGQPGLAGIELTAMADAEARTLAMQAGQLDLLVDVTATQAELFAGAADASVLTFPSGRFNTLVMQIDTAPFDDVRVRKALRLVADRQAMIDLVLNGEGTIACDTPVMPSDAYRWDGECPQDIEGAKALLAEAGYPDGIDVTLYTSSVAPELIPLAEVYQQQAAAAGIRVALEVVPADSYWSEVWLVQPMFASLWQERPADQILNEAWRSTAKWNESHFQNSAFDQLLDQARTELDFESRRATYQAAQQMIADEGGNLIPYHVNQFYVVSNQVTGVPARNWQHMVWHTITKSE